MIRHEYLYFERLRSAGCIFFPQQYDTALIRGYDRGGFVQELLINKIVITSELLYLSIRGTYTATDRDIVKLTTFVG